MRIDPLGNHRHLVPEIARLHFDEWKHFSPAKTLDDRILKLERIAQSTDVPLMLVAIDHDQLIGTAALVEHDMARRTDLSPWLASVFVKPEFRNKGIATILVNRIEDEARKRSIETLYLFTEYARDLYAGLGWHDLEKCEYQGVDVTIMCKRVAT